MSRKGALQHVLTKTLLSLTFVGFSGSAVFAKEGMWLPPTLPVRAADMQSAGLQIPVEQIYNDNGTGLNQAVVLFGKGCTGELISGQGLILTNHHCGYGTVQGLVSRDNDYFAAGFWAMNRQQEIPCPGLTVTFIRKMENVTDKIIYDLPDTMADARRDSVVAIRVRALEKGYRLTSKLDAKIEPYFRGNQYWVILTETFKDVRLVGFPPDGIGKFGGDTDNWMWPRQTGDFSLFRVYAGKNNQPAEYNKENKPYLPKRFFSINTSGYKEGDFTMVYGFPGNTQEYIAAPQLKQIQDIQDPIRIDLRTRKLAVWSEAMDADRDIFLKYTSKRAYVANGWKKFQGELKGLRANQVGMRKEADERAFQYWADYDSTVPYADNLLSQIQASSGVANRAIRTEEYIKEGLLGIELIQQGAELDKLLQQWRKNEQLPEKTLKEFRTAWSAFYKNYDPATDQKVFATLMPIYMKEEPQNTPSLYTLDLQAANGDYKRWASSVYARTVVTDSNRGIALLTGARDTVAIKNDAAWQMYNAINQLRRAQIYPVLNQYNPRINRLNRLYMAAQMKRGAGELFYPDANLTLRLAYGHIKGIDPDGPAEYSYQTNIDQVMAKGNDEDPEFRLPEKYKELYVKRDYGRWAIPGANGEKTVPVAFVADNHTSGGNSGSPVLNAKGELIGTNFDRVWEGTMSDLYFDPALCRNISLDVRYTLWVIEKFGGAGWLLKEMRLVK